MNIIHSIFSLILKFRAQLIAQPWDSQQGEAVHPSFVAMQQSYNTFKYYSHFLFKGKCGVQTPRARIRPTCDFKLETQ